MMFTFCSSDFKKEQKEQLPITSLDKTRRPIKATELVRMKNDVVNNYIK